MPNPDQNQDPNQVPADDPAALERFQEQQRLAAEQLAISQEGPAVARILRYVEDRAEQTLHRQTHLNYVEHDRKIEQLSQRFEAAFNRLQTELQANRETIRALEDRDVTMATVAAEEPQLSTVPDGATFLPPSELRQFTPQQRASFAMFQSNERTQELRHEFGENPRFLGIRSGLKLPTFDGSDYSAFSNWDSRIRLYLNTHFVPKAHQCAFIFQALVGQAAADTRHLAHLAAPGSDPNVYLRQLREVFRPTSTLPIARTQYAACRQRSTETVKEFANRIREAYIDAFPDEAHETSPHLIQHFIEGLINPDIGTMVQRKDYRVFSHAVTKAIHEANLLQHNRLRQGKKTPTCDLGTPNPRVRDSGAARIASISRDSPEGSGRPRVDTVRKYCDFHKTDTHGTQECRGRSRSPSHSRGRDRSNSRDSRGQGRRRSGSRTSPRRGILRRERGSKDRDRLKTRFSRKPRVANVDAQDDDPPSDSDSSPQGDEPDQRDVDYSDEYEDHGVVDSLFAFHPHGDVNSLSGAFDGNLNLDGAAELTDLTDDESEQASFPLFGDPEMGRTDEDDAPTDDDVPADYIHEDPEEASGADRQGTPPPGGPLIGAGAALGIDPAEEADLLRPGAGELEGLQFSLTEAEAERIMAGDAELGLKSAPLPLIQTSAELAEPRIAQISAGDDQTSEYPDLGVDTRLLKTSSEGHQKPDSDPVAGPSPKPPADVDCDPPPKEKSHEPKAGANWADEVEEEIGSEAAGAPEMPSKRRTSDPDEPLRPSANASKGAERRAKDRRTPASAENASTSRKGRKRRRQPSPTSATSRQDEAGDRDSSGRHRQDSTSTTSTEASRPRALRSNILRHLKKINKLKREMDIATLYVKDTPDYRPPSADLRADLDRRRQSDPATRKDGTQDLFGPLLNLSHVRAECDRIQAQCGPAAGLAVRAHAIRQLIDTRHAREILKQVCDEIEGGMPGGARNVSDDERRPTTPDSSATNPSRVSRRINPARGRLRYAADQTDPFRLVHGDGPAVRRMDEFQHDVLYERMMHHLHSVTPCPEGFRPLTEGELNATGRIASLQKIRRSFLRRLHREEVDLISAQLRARDPLRDLLPEEPASAR